MNRVVLKASGSRGRPAGSAWGARLLIPGSRFEHHAGCGGCLNSSTAFNCKLIQLPFHLISHLLSFYLFSVTVGKGIWQVYVPTTEHFTPPTLVVPPTPASAAAGIQIHLGPWLLFPILQMVMGLLGSP